MPIECILAMAECIPILPSLGVIRVLRRMVMPISDGRALANARRKKGWTQAELSEACKPRIDISTISRIERGKPTRVRASTLKAFAKALEVQPETLCPTPEAERDVMKLRIDSAARNALTLVAIRYGIRRESIVEIAPLLFFIAAEQCLQQRRERIAELRASARAMLDLQRDIGHLPTWGPLDDHVVQTEEHSIQARDLFGKEVLKTGQAFGAEFDDDFDEAEQNPFVRFLRDNLAKVSNSPEIAESVWWEPGLWPHYEICTEEAANIVGSDAKAAHAIVDGVAALHEIPKGSPEQRADWARAEFDRKYGPLNELIDEALRDSADRPTVDGQASTSGDAP